MFALTIKELAARKLRLLTTAFAVLLGVAFMSGTLIFTDTIGATYDAALAEANAGVDVYVRTPSEIDIGYGEPGPRLDASLAQTVASVDGVDQVALRINGYAQLVGADGQPVGDVSKSPAFGTNWVTVAELNPYELVSGHAPRSDAEVVIDKASADKAGYHPGDVATVLTKAEPRQVTIAGIATFGGDDSPAGATAVLFTDAAAAELLASPGRADGIVVSGDPGVSQTDLAAAVQSAVGGQVEAITGATLTAEEQATLAALIGTMATIFLIFALVAVFVSAFIINNTFSITVSQRIRQMAMLRAIGASGRQVKRSVLIEALVVSVVAAATGLVAGVGVAAGLRQLMSAFGFDMPDGPTVIRSSAMITSFLVGVVVTVVSAWLPARRAARIAPIAAVRSVDIDSAARSARRTVAGVVIGGAGVAALVSGIAGDDVQQIGLGAFASSVGLLVLGPVLARPVAWIFGIPLRLRGLTGELATRNAVRNPTRTARTAASLTIGVALVAFMTIFASSAKASLAGSLESEFVGTHIVQAGGPGSSGGLSPALAGELRRTAGIDVVAQSRVTPAVVDGQETKTFYAFDTVTVDQLFRLGAIDGDLHGLGTDGIAVSSERAQAEGWTIGSPVHTVLPAADTTFVVEAIYSGGTDWVGDMFVDLAAFDANNVQQIDAQVFVKGDESAVTSAAASYASAHVLDKSEFLDEASTEIDTMLGMFYALLMLAVVIALLGIANTLALSIFERTREIGLMRSVGMRRSQVRSTVRWESIIIAVFGATIGLAIGTVFGWAIVTALAEQGISTLSIPANALAVIAAIAAIAGAAAAVMPARRAAKLDVLTALADT